MLDEIMSGLPADTENPAIHKQEHAPNPELARVFEQARYKQEAIKILEEDPTIDTVALVDRLEEMRISDEGTDSHVWEFVASLGNMRDKVASFLKGFSELDSDETAIEVYKALCVGLYRHLSPDFVPKGKIKLKYDYPLAIGLEIEDKEDYSRIYNKPSGGVFKHIEIGREGTFGSANSHIPLIVSKFSNSPNILRHEMGHAQNYALQAMALSDNQYPWVPSTSTYKTFKSLPKNQYPWTAAKIRDEVTSLADIEMVSTYIGRYSAHWGSFYSDPELTNISYRLNRLIDHIDSPFSEDTIMQSMDTQKAISYSLSCVKDEILAERLNGGGWLKSHMTSLREINGTYDYLRNDLFLDDRTERSRELHVRLWELYLESMSKLAGKTIGYLQKIQNMPALEKRAQTMRYVLMDIPMEEWDKRLTELGFFEEEAQITGTLRTYTYLSSYIWNAKRIHMTDDERQLHTSVHTSATNLMKEFDQFLGEHASTSIGPDLPEYQEKLGKMLVDFGISEVGYFIESYTRLETMLIHAMGSIDNDDPNFEYIYETLDEHRQKLMDSVTQVLPENRAEFLARSKVELNELYDSLGMKKPKVDTGYSNRRRRSF